MEKNMNDLSFASRVAVAITYVKLSDLYLSPLNPRQATDPEGDKILADSLLACGLMQNLSVVQDAEGKYGVVAGGRRLRALRIAVERDPSFGQVPVHIAPDEATAITWAGAENSAREDLSPADEISAYARSAEGGASVGEIARSFAVTEAHVRRRLKLASLPVTVLDALAQKKISLDMASAFTISNDEALTQAVLDWAVNNSYANAESVRRRLQPAAVTDTDNRVKLVGVEAYEAAGGQITRDLFSDNIYFTDTELLDSLAETRLEAEAEAIRTTEGWAWAEVRNKFYSFDKNDMKGLSVMSRVPNMLDPEEQEEFVSLDMIARPWAYNDCDEEEEGENDEEEEYTESRSLTAEQMERYGELREKQKAIFTPEQRAVGGIIVTLGFKGADVTRGLLKYENREEAAATGALTGESADNGSEETEKSAYSGSLTGDLQAVRLAAVQTALLRKPDLVLDLLAFALMAGTGAPTRIIGLKPEIPVNLPSVEEGLIFDPRLHHKKYDYGEDPTKAEFEEFEAKPKKDRTAVLVEGIARTLDRHSKLFDVILGRTEANIRSIWTPTAANFFSRVSAPYLTDLLKSLLEVEDDDDRIKAFVKMKKGEKAVEMEKLFSGDQTYRKLNAITKNQATRIDAWFPEDAL